MNWLTKYEKVLRRESPIKKSGTVQKVQGLMIESLGPQAQLGECCRIVISDALAFSRPAEKPPEDPDRKAAPGEVSDIRRDLRRKETKPPAGERRIMAEVVGFKDHLIQLMPLSTIDGLSPGARVTALGGPLAIPVSPGLLGRVLDSSGSPMDGKGSIGPDDWYPAQNNPSHVLTRRPIRDRLITGVRAIDGLLPMGKGQRMGIFSGPGIGKSTLLGMIARNTQADVNVIALIGERGREVREFIENDLGSGGMKRSVLVVSTSDSPPLAKIRGAYTAMAVAEYFRDLGKDVMLFFDSVTRFAQAQREIGLALGEPPATKGFTPSVFEKLQQLLERAGTSDRGSITGFFTILVEGDDMDEPVASNTRAILDGHIVLSRRLASAYHYPAIDIHDSISRLDKEIALPEEKLAMGRLRRLWAAYYEAEDLINVGAYAPGSNPVIDEALAKWQGINDFLTQEVEEAAGWEDTRDRLIKLSRTVAKSQGRREHNLVV
ncbi:MAG: FliI/YscN family ATPase [Spirochaetales bacterium]|jgi:flagellum-specific ATP synthase|nr:FliI/YscN family ATPase [Spirochaetales bacterium]